MRADAPTEVEAVPSTAALWPIAVAFVVVVTAPTPHAVFVASELVSPCAGCVIVLGARNVPQVAPCARAAPGVKATPKASALAAPRRATGLAE